MIRFTFLRPSDSRLSPEHRAQYLSIRRLVKWEVIDPSGTYSGLIIIGEQIIGVHATPPGFVPNANMTINRRERELPAAKVQELSQLVKESFFDPHMGVDVRFESPTVQ